MTTAAVQFEISRANRRFERRATHVVAAAVLVILAALATWPVWQEVFRYAARNEEQSHSFFAVPIAAWLVWVRRARLTHTQPSWSMIGPAIVAIGWCSLVLGFRVGLQGPQTIGAVLVLLGAAYAALGRNALLNFLAAFVAMLILLPIPGRIRFAIAAPLQQASAFVAAGVLDLFGIPVVRSGNMLSVNGVDVAVAEACNGMRMVSALAVVAYTYVFSTPLRANARAGILLASPLIAVAINVLRLVPTAVCYGYASHQTADVVHELGGWVALGLALIALLAITSLLRWLELPIDLVASPAGELWSGRARRQLPRRQGTHPPELVPLVTASLLGAMFVLGGFTARAPAGIDEYLSRVRTVIGEVPYRIGNSVGADQPPSSGVGQILRPNAVLDRQFTDPATRESFVLSIVHCSDVRDLLDHYPPVCYPSSGWTPEGTQRLSFTSGTTQVPACLYTYSRRSSAGEMHTRVLSFLVLPRSQGGAVDDMEAVGRASRSTTGTALGATHVLLAFPGDASDTRIASIFQSTLDTLGPVIRTILEGTRGE